VEQTMRDVIFAIGTIVFFVLSILYLRACERLK
jgi:cbb3-type cytochrome oxidase subunit 3